MAQAVQDPRVVEGVRDQLGYRPRGGEDVYDYEDDMIPSGQHRFNQLEVAIAHWAKSEPRSTSYVPASASNPSTGSTSWQRPGAEPRNSLEVAEARAVSHGKGAAAERQHVVTADPITALQPGDAPSF
ncbi:hypothetical protein HJ588_15700 [Flexivirga sp. ID2601S]|uniref:Uncharacterized protein n=1 Tax=Flexivirga aerilata TaxID=1656889 RepID=A0A849AK22_9MICO|nr:hypothetical protein [Flexivirga aerilata]NNG40709.1 hypothetical protein [Flexivirga aerilata]